MNIKNCINCGAPIHKTKCDYCGTEYSENGNIVASFDRCGATGTIKVGDREIACYLSHMEAHPLYPADVGRDLSGHFYRGTAIIKRKFTLIEI